MPVDARQVTGRRSLKYHSLDDFLADAERLAGAEVVMLGNWSLGQVFRHLATAVPGSMDGFAFRLSLHEIIYVRLFLKDRLLARASHPATATAGGGIP